MTDKKVDIIFNISGGNNQILPNATHAEQHFYGGYPVEQKLALDTDTSDLSPWLAIYISNEEVRARYVERLRACLSAAEVGRTVVAMVQEIQGLTIDTVKTTLFISILLNLAKSVESGVTVPNFRKAIVNAWFAKKD